MINDKNLRFSIEVHNKLYFKLNIKNFFGVCGIQYYYNPQGANPIQNSVTLLKDNKNK